MVGGLMPIPDDARKSGAGPAWMGYIGVDDVDNYADRVKKAGGAIHRTQQRASFLPLCAPFDAARAAARL